MLIAYAGLLILFGLSVFQLSLILGKPFGEYAWGGQQRVLPKKLRIASVSSIVLYVVFGVFLASKAGITQLIPESSFLDIGMWVLTGYFALGVLVNGISRSKKERMVMTPIALLLAVIFFAVASS